MLIVLRGNSGSGKSTLAAELQRRLGWPTAILGQDHFRRTVYKERELDGDKPRGPAHVGMLAAAARHALASGHHVILEGIFAASRYSAVLEHIATLTEDLRFYGYDLTFDETTARHATRPQSSEFTPEQMAEWFHGWDPLPFVAERRIRPGDGIDETAARILADA